jgi:1-deoxy-D-xylulose-5-phosphate synthase
LRAPIELGRAEILNWGRDGVILCCGTRLGECQQAARKLQDQGLDVGVVNSRFVKPLDPECRTCVRRRIRRDLEEGCLVGGYGSAVLETAIDAGWDAPHPPPGASDRFIEHGERQALLATSAWMRAGSSGLAWQ